MRLPRFSRNLPGPLALTLSLSPAVARLVMLLVAASVTALLLLVFGNQFRLLEERVGSEAWKLGAQSVPEERLTLVAIDERSLARIGPWPWSRETMAELSTALSDAGAQLQIYDVVFPEQREGDQQLVTALSAGNSVLAQVPVIEARQNIQAGTLTHALSGVSCTGAAATHNYVGNHQGFAGLPKGHITPIVASDGGVRHVPAFVCVDSEAYPALAISALLTAVGAQQEGAGGWRATLQSGDSLLGPAATLTLDAYPGLTIPLDANGNIRISYGNLPDTYRAVSAADVLDGAVDPAMLDNTWVLIGATAFGLGDIVPTPYSGITPGVELQARIISSLLDADMPWTPRGAPLLLWLLAGAGALVLLVLASFRQRLAMYGLPVAAVLLPFSALVLHAVLLTTANIWLGWLVPALFSVLAASLLLLLEHSRVRLEHDRVYNNLNSYLPSDVAREIAYSVPSSDINARRLDVTLLSADLRNFSAYTEARPPEESAALLHSFFVLTTAIIERHEGRVHEFRGDGLLAVWSGDSEGVQQALNAALEMQAVVQRDLLPARAPEGLEPLGLGIGVEQGPVLMGSIGPAQRRSHTLLGDTVTIALRVQEMTAELALPVLVGESAARLAGDPGLQSQGRFLLPGLRAPHTLYSIGVVDSGDNVDQARSNTPALKVLAGGRSQGPAA